MMKKILVIMVALLALAGPTQAQSGKTGKQPTQQQLDAVLLPMFGNNAQKLHNYPMTKQLIRYYFSFNSFYVTDETPAQGIPVYDLSVLRNVITSTYMDNNAQVDPATLSYYGYNFSSLQVQHPGSQIAFRTPGCSHAYLMLRTPTEANAVSIANNQYNM